MFTGTMSFLKGFEEIDDLFIDFNKVFNNAGGLSLVGDTSGWSQHKQLHKHEVMFLIVFCFYRCLSTQFSHF